jgi:hypothetical protein
MSARGSSWVALGVCLTIGCAGRFPPGWLYVTRVDPTAATIVWTGDAGAGATCRATRGVPVTAAGQERGRGLVTARLEALVPDTRYACLVRDAAGRVLHRVSFRTAPATPDTPVLFTVVGDTGNGGPVARAIARRIRASHPSFLIHVGDLAYTHGTVAEVGRSFFRPYLETLHRVPLYPTPGNHDLFARSAYRDLFAPVSEGSGGGYRYHFTWGPAAFVSLSAPEAAAGGDGLAGDFGAAQAWRIVFLHEPLYTAGRKRVEPGLRATFGPVVEAAGVDLVLAGHQHFYERSEPSCEFDRAARVSHVTTGGGSDASLDPVRAQPNFPRALSVPHFLRVRVSRDRLDVRAVGVDGRTLDRLRRERGIDPGCRAQGWPRQRPRRR